MAFRERRWRDAQLTSLVLFKTAPLNLPYYQVLRTFLEYSVCGLHLAQYCPGNTGLNMAKGFFLRDPKTSWAYC